MKTKKPKTFKCPSKAEGCHGEYQKWSSLDKTCKNPACIKAEDDARKAKKSKKPKPKKKRAPNSAYYHTKAKDLFMPQFRGQPCGVCKATEGTCGHHVVSQSRSKALKFDRRNIIVLCPSHHTMGNDMAPHASNQLAVERFIEWFKVNRAEQHKWLVGNERIQRRFTYKQAIENMTDGREAWDNE